ncbi:MULTISPECIES: hypothetical protein [Thalassospira]|nr:MULTISPECIES: hypothetical protein [Thalassospira]
MEVDAGSDIDALKHFARKLDEPLTLDDSESMSPYVMDFMEPNKSSKERNQKISLFLEVSSS